jgi:hypothetical protein
LEKYRDYDVPRHFIDHGLADEFIGISAVSKKDDLLHIGYSGNLLRHDIDREVLLQIIRGNPGIIFEFWGACLPESSNVGGGSDSTTISFIQELKNNSNVVLHGAVSFWLLPDAFSRMDGFLICYDMNAQYPIGPNYHKIMEFLSTGKVVISSYVRDYEFKPDLIEMVRIGDNCTLPDIFSNIIKRISEFNSPARLKLRQDFAYDHTYEKQIDRIESLLSEL